MTRYLILATTLAAAACGAPQKPDVGNALLPGTTVTYRVVNDCLAGTATRVLLQDPNGKVHDNGISCTAGPIMVADTVKADTAPKK